jgi:hypothetical protein
MQRQVLENECRREAERHGLKLWRHHGQYVVTDDENRPIVGVILRVYSLDLAEVCTFFGTIAKARVEAEQGRS